MSLNHNTERRMKRILLAGLGIGLAIGVVGSSFVGSFLDKREEEKQNANVQSDYVPGLEQEKEEEGPNPQIMDAEEIAKMNAESLASDDEDWMLTVVNSVRPLQREYQPELVEIEPGKQVDKRIQEELSQMLADAKEAGLNMYICSAYRSYDYQRQVFNETVVSWIQRGYIPMDAYTETAKSVAVPGTSEHATGLALDITSATFPELDDRQAETPEAKWLKENCWKYGFVLRYPVDKSEVTGIVFEPWHYRYVGKKAAKEIMEQGITLEEYEYVR